MTPSKLAPCDHDECPNDRCTHNNDNTTPTNMKEITHQSPPSNLWLVLRAYGQAPPSEFIGAFDTAAAAEALCSDSTFLVCPTTRNVPMGHDVRVWPDAWFIVRCVVAAVNANGSPDLFFVKVRCSELQFDAGWHYDAAMAAAKQEGYEPKLAFDESDDGGDRLMASFVWESASIVGAKAE